MIECLFFGIMGSLGVAIFLSLIAYAYWLGTQK